MKLAIRTNHVTLRMGGQMRREEEGEWSVRAPGDVSFEPVVPTVLDTNAPPAALAEADPAAAAATNSPAGAAAPAAASGAESDILKKLMERREKELNK